MKNIVVLVSGSGTNLQRLIDAAQSGEIRNARIAKVIADRECYALQRASDHRIPSVLIPRGKNFSVRLAAKIPEDTDLIVLAGFLSILSKDFCEKWNGRIVNIHPALLPKYGGKGMWGHHVHEAVLAAGEAESGASVHFVTAGIDEGAVVLQKSFKIDERDTLQSLQEKVHDIEYEIFPKAVDSILNSELSE